MRLSAHRFSTGTSTPPDPLKSNNDDDYDDKQSDVAVTQKQPGFDTVSQARNALRDRINSKRVTR
jgi:hypothetical protein